MPKGRVLVISTWGFPPQWGRYRYRVGIEHKRFQQPDLPKDFECESCCTTLVLTSYLSKPFDIDVLVFGVDTVVDPSGAGDSVRNEAEKLYKVWSQDLVRTCSCCGDIDWQKTLGISILPGVGHYHGWHFKASIDNLFVKTFHKIYKKMIRADYDWVFLDLTHGLNYVVVTALYATIANTIIFGKEDRLLIVNSEPATGTNIRCVLLQQPLTGQRQAQGQGQDAPTLTILDVSRLQQAISFIRSIVALKYLQPYPFGSVLKEIKRFDPAVGKSLEEHVLPFFKLLSNGVVGPTFGNSYTIGGQGEEEPSPYALCRYRRQVFENIGVGVEDYEFRPTKVDQELKIVEYGRANMFSVLLLALETIVDTVCNELAKCCGDTYLQKYLGNVADYYDKVGAVANKLIVKRASQELGQVVDKVITGLDHLIQNRLAVEVSSREISIDGKLYRAITYMKEEPVDTDRSRSLDRLEKIEEEIRRAREEISDIEKDPDRFLRNMCAHAGFEYTTTEKIVIDVVEKDIVKIVYNKQLLDKLLRHGKIIE